MIACTPCAHRPASIWLRVLVASEHGGQIKLVEFLEEGEDHLRAGFEWQPRGYIAA